MASSHPAIVNLPAHRARLPGNEISFLLVPLDPAYQAGLAGHLPVKLQSIHNRAELHYHLSKKGTRRKERKFPQFRENTVVHEHNLLEKWGTHRG
jgi:hypothetical protein